MAHFSRLRNVIHVDDDDDGDDGFEIIGSLTVPASSNPLSKPIARGIDGPVYSTLSSDTLALAASKSRSNGELEGLHSSLSSNIGGKAPQGLDALVSVFSSSTAPQLNMELAPTRNPASYTHILERKRPRYPAETLGEVGWHGKRAKTSAASSVVRREHVLPIHDAHTPIEPGGSPSRLLPHRRPTVEEMRHTFVEMLEVSDDDIEEVSINTWRNVKNAKPKVRQVNEVDIVYDFDDFDDSMYEDLAEEIRDLAIVEQPTGGNKSIQSPWAVCETAITNEGSSVKPGQVLELTDRNLLYVVTIVKHITTGEIMLRGHSLVRSSSINGLLPRKLNEVVWQTELELNDERPCHQQSMTEQPLSLARKPRELRITNRLYPAGSFRDTGGFYDRDAAERSAPCTMRWKYTSTFLNAGHRKDNKWYEKSLEHIKIREVPNGPAYLVVDDMRLRFEFRGTTIPGGAYKAIEPAGQSNSISGSGREMAFTRDSSVQESIASSRTMRASVDKNLETVDLTAENNTQHSPPETGWLLSGSKNSDIAVPELTLQGSRQRYSYGDAFCGAGGATAGAAMAGLKVIWGFDANEHACSSWAMNFPESQIYNKWAHDFVKLGERNDKMKVDILHLSPPCQFFSPAHTVEGKDDEVNSASLFACGELLDVTRPRIATLEQTFGIIALPRFRLYFNSLVQMFTCKGYSIRWKVACLQNWGLPQRRQRLIMIASCPGEQLPEFPPFTHCDPLKPQPGRLPWVSVDSVLNEIPAHAPDHNLAGVTFPPPGKIPWSGASIMPRCITTHGGHNYHPTGIRGFTNREYASLQGFPFDHLFSQYNVKKQIGNAVPPSIAKILFESIRKWLEKVDGIKAGHFEVD